MGDASRAISSVTLFNITIKKTRDSLRSTAEAGSKVSKQLKSDYSNPSTTAFNVVLGRIAAATLVSSG